MSNEIRGYGWRPVIQANRGKYLPAQNKIKSGLFARVEIKNHMEKYGVDLSCCAPDDTAAYENFSDYLSRSFKEGERPIDADPNALICPCDGYLTAHFINNLCTIAVSGHMYSVEKLLDHDAAAKEFAEGLALIFRIDDADPHRFIQIDDGMISDFQTLSAEKNQEDSLFFGPRSYTLMNLRHFHTVAQIEACGNPKGVEQFAPEGEHPVFVKGQDKGRFLCSTAGIILLFKKGMVFPDDEFMANTRMGLETRVRMGEKIGIAIAASLS